MNNNSNSHYFKFINVLKIIYDNSSKEKPISTTEIKESLLSMYNLKIDTRTIQNIVSVFNNTDSVKNHIVETRTSTLQYYFEEHNIEFFHAKAIIDMIYSSKFFSKDNKDSFMMIMKKYFNEEKSKNLEKKLLVHINANETDSSFSDSYNKIIQAICDHKEISFIYSKPQPSGEHSLTKREECLWPIETYYDNNTFYLYCYNNNPDSENYKKIMNYRIDFIKNVSLNKSFTLSQAIREQTRNIIMYSSSGISAERFADISFIVDKHIYPNFVDKFGVNMGIPKKIDDNNFLINVYDCPVSHMLYAWIIVFKSKIKIHSPAKEVNAFENYLKKYFLS